MVQHKKTISDQASACACAQSEDGDWKYTEEERIVAGGLVCKIDDGSFTRSQRFAMPKAIDHCNFWRGKQTTKTATTATTTPITMTKR